MTATLNQASGSAPTPKLIAEIGNNHLGDVQRAHEMLAQALEAGVDAVTFQVREPRFYEAPEMAHLMLPLEFFAEAAETAHRAQRQFGIAICDISLISKLNDMGVDFWKTLSWDFRNEQLRGALQNTGKPIFYSTGVSGMQEVVEVGSKLHDAILIHTQLSNALVDVNLKAIKAMREAVGLPIAFGLHCDNHDVLKLALAFEPHSLFFYVKVTGIHAYDDEHAISMERLAQTVRELRELMPSVGTGIKQGQETPAWVRASK